MSVAGISIVIPNYNGEFLLPQILPTVFIAAENSGVSFEVIVADDCSTDGTLQVLKEKFPLVKILQNEINSGFSVTSNKGVKAATYDWVLLLNSDVKLNPDYFQHLLKYTCLVNVLGVMGRIVGWENNKIQDGAKYPFFHGVKIKTSGNYLLQDEEAMKKGIYSMYLSGANAFLSKAVFLKIGGFNELFSPFYVEDFELSLRAWRLGYKCYYDHNAVCRHRVSTTITNRNKKSRVKIIYNRNKMYLHAIHLDGSKRILWFFQLAGEILIYLFIFKWTHLRSVSRFLKSYKGIEASRRRLRQVAGEKKLLSVNDVANKIISSLSGEKIRRF